MIYAFGDIHGRLDLLDQALDMVTDMAVTLCDDKPQLLFCGDYVDRGPDSKGVVDKLIQLQSEGAICLRGNHEQLMIDALTERTRFAVSHWLANGGDTTLTSYGGVVPPEVLGWMEALPLYYETANHVFVHAGMQPGVALSAHDPETLMWIRQAFLRRGAGEFDKHIVHGHTPQWDGKPNPAEPELLAHRTNLDTGAYATGVLTVGVFDPMQAEPIALLSTED
jgi:serine/threonine protein phosphatase 1